VSDMIKLHAPTDARIVLKITEKDGSSGETVMWGEGSSETMRSAVLVALSTPTTSASGQEETSGSAVGEVEVDDRISATVAEDVLDSNEIARRIVSFVALVVKTAVADDTLWVNTSSNEEETQQ